MFYLRILPAAILLALLCIVHSFAQDHFYSDDLQGQELTLANIKFDSTSGDVYSIPLRKYGLKKSNYSAIVSVRFNGDSTAYHLPGPASNGNSFGVRLKAGRKGRGDTLAIIRREGIDPVMISQLKILFLRGKSIGGSLKRDNEFAEFLLTRYSFHKSSYSTTAYYQR